MKKIIFLLFAGFFLVSCISWNGGHTEGLQDNKVLILSKSFNASDIKDVEVETSGGSISVTGDATGQATVEVFGQGNNGRRLSKDEILQVLRNDYEFSVTAENGTLKGIAKRTISGRWKNAVSISFKIHVAKNVNADLHTSGGSIRLASLHGNENFGTSGGSIHFEQLSGTINGHTSGGGITALNSKGNIEGHTSGGPIKLEELDGEIEMHTSGGSIEASHVSGNLDLSTSGGGIRLEDIAAKLSAHTSGGSIHANFTTFKQNAELSTSGGSIKVNVPKSAHLDFELKGSRVNIGSANNIQVDMNKQKSHATGSLNNGGAQLGAHTSGGSVSLDFK